MLAPKCVNQLFCGGKLVWRSYVEISKYLHLSGSSTLRKPLCETLRTRGKKNHAFHTKVPLREEKSSAPSDIDFMESYKASLHFPSSTHQIKDLDQRLPLGGEEVILHGYLGSRSDLSKNLTFVPLLDESLRWSVQIVSSAKSNGGRVKPAHERLKSLAANSPVVVKGLLKVREPAAQKDLGDFRKIKTVEVDLWDVQSLNSFPKDIILTEDTHFLPDQRHLQLRTDRSARIALWSRAIAVRICREYLGDVSPKFVEIETPILFKSTPEGAREFLVPTRRKGLAYALPQSPQQYKQMLMASGFTRYYQFARCFRDEDLRADRQPEFTQLDLEMSFVNSDNVMKTVERLIKILWNGILHLDMFNKDFPRIKYHEAMSKYGTDKPDVRLGMEISEISYLLPADLIGKIGPGNDPYVEVLKLHVAAEAEEARKFVTTFMESPESASFQKNPEGSPGVFIVDSRKPLQGLQPFGFEAAERLEDLLGLEDGDVVILQAREKAPYSGGSTPLGNLRLALHKAAVAQGYIPAPTGFEFLWVTDFPLFTPTNDTDPGQGGTAGLSSTHHPFTSPMTAEDVDLLVTDPTKAKGDHYDLVVNGVELGGGSRRIHNSQMQEFVLNDVLKMTPERRKDFSHLLEVLRAGCPPHAGMALGFDRLIAVMLGKDSIRDVIAFPKSSKGDDLLVNSPSVMSEEALDTYHLKLKD
ncbi:MAG: hypothetical protein M1827_002005 [Pycnora praestabilis]|nr:MAG: hypothetical protein M1827_002005 [Pycnora praestabilis]